jgi:hypothetical protein
MARPGRTQRIAVDETPLNAAAPDVRARLGWLLAMSRLHHRDESFQDGGHFAEALGRAGYPASRSLVSRWESGLVPVPHEGMSAYERALGLEPGLLTSVRGYLAAELPEGSERVRPRLDPADRAFATRFDALIDAAEEGTARPGDWEELGWHLAAVPLVHLRAATWETLATRIVDLLPRSVNVGYRQLSAAAMTMAALPRAQDPLVQAIHDHLADPAVQVVANPLVLLDRLPTRESARLVLETLEQPRNLLSYQMGVWLARQKMVRGEFTPAERAELHMLVLRSWRSDAAQASEYLAELIVDLPDGMRSTLVQAAVQAGRPKLEYVVEHGEDVLATKAQAFAAALAEAAREGAPQPPVYAEDRMLTRLVREALFHRDTERRHRAALLLSASPFAGPATDALLARLNERADPVWLRARLATLVRYVCDDSHRLRMLSLVDDPVESVAVPVTQGLGHLALSLTSDQQVRAALLPQWSPRERAKLYVLGMTASPALGPLARSATAPGWQRAAARWWLDHGSAVRA